MSLSDGSPRSTSPSSDDNSSPIVNHMMRSFLTTTARLFNEDYGLFVEVPMDAIVLRFGVADLVETLLRAGRRAVLNVPNIGDPSVGSNEATEKVAAAYATIFWFHYADPRFTPAVELRANRVLQAYRLRSERQEWIDQNGVGDY
ncbi:hypothetical protein QR680_007093 [Steinernema hermaphroditum]|uniref:Uncharacterized protein n=1 Tax=Steinernema hermaphroditum TaxID=289476 RepID=A0AA39HZ89_9BILA|nr:hypothetical protein QR680_007093 [Steinernema hermaphroditum]